MSYSSTDLKVISKKKTGKGNVIPVTGRGGPLLANPKLSLHMHPFQLIFLADFADKLFHTKLT
jgi:hypothetical protein